jgi:carbonic anhydrase
MVSLCAGITLSLNEEQSNKAHKNNALGKILAEREHLFRQRERRFRKKHQKCSPSTGMSVHVQSEWVFILSRNMHYERMGRDVELGGNIYIIETGYQEVHIFWSH